MKPRAIVVIGGGSTGRDGPVTTTPIDREVIRLTGKQRPNVLFVPTAHRDAAGGIERFIAHYGDTLGCPVKILYLYDQRGSDREIQQLIGWADLIYVGGGNPLLMLKRWRQFGVDKLLTKAHQRGAVLAGMSAGAMCWFQFGLTDCWRIDHDPSKALVCRGLNLIPGLCNPHANTNAWRPARLKTVLERRSVAGISIDEHAALIVEGDSFRVMSAEPNEGTQRTFWQRGKYNKESLPAHGSLALLEKRG